MSRVLVFDSGLGGVTVYRALRDQRPDVALGYLADNAVFPYGDLGEDALIKRTVEVIGAGLSAFRPEVVVIACNTASTLCLPAVRSAFPEIDIVGTVPAIKPAARSTRSGQVSVLATPGTVRRDYTQALIHTFARHVEVTLVGAPNLAKLAEDFALTGKGDRNAVAREIAPCFVETQRARTDTVVLACTHYPLLLPLLETLAPWPVGWIDPADAIARRVGHLIGQTGAPAGQDPPLFVTQTDADLTGSFAKLIGELPTCVDLMIG
ncbi:MAG: glutamate racemase [Pseudomonadota bacterium]